MIYQTNTIQPIREIETQWITMDDGCKLAARIWLPLDAENNPVPAILESVPYRRRDGYAMCDASRQPYTAGHGYACVRLDPRGIGDSEGIILDEYTAREHNDLCTVIDWLANQCWCNGNVGMWGISWSGFNSLQMAAINPPALKAIITLCASDDRYANDAHYLGGCLIEANLRWGTRFLSETARPPDPEVVGSDWRAMWINRLENLQLFPHIWLQHQARDEYWKHGSICESFNEFQVPVFSVGGWSDAYVNAVGTTLAGVQSPKLGLIGPWGHDFPHDARPNPAINFLGEAIRWWDYWLKGIETGIMDEPVLRAWMIDSELPSTIREERLGHWICNNSWPPDNSTSRTYFLNTDSLELTSNEETILLHQSPTTVGIEGGEWNVWGSGSEFSGDQRQDDGQSLCFDTAPLIQDCELFGSTVVKLSFSVDQPQAFLAVRLCDVWPNGSSNRVTFGLINLTHLVSHEHPQDLVPGQRYEVNFSLRDIAYTVPVGHRLRLAISTNYWPLVWPSANPVTLSLHTGVSTISLPEKVAGNEEKAGIKFGPATGTKLIEHKVLVPADSNRLITRELGSERTRYKVERNSGVAKLMDTNITCGSRGEAEFEICDNNPLSATHTERTTQILERDNWKIRIEAETTLKATEKDFLLTAVLKAFENDNCIHKKNWDYRIPRNGL